MQCTAHATFVVVSLSCGLKVVELVEEALQLNLIFLSLIYRDHTAFSVSLLSSDSHRAMLAPAKCFSEECVHGSLVSVSF